MANWFHGKPTNHPSQIKLLSEGNLNYKKLFDEVQAGATNKNASISSITKYKLKDDLTRDIRRIYYTGIDIKYHDLEKQFRAGRQILSGRSLVDMAVRGIKTIKKPYHSANINGISKD